MKRVLIYGDSNTWGYTPLTGVRYDENTRWPKVVAKQLGDEYEIIENGVSGRTTVYDLPWNDSLNGMKGLGTALLASMPLDLVVIKLGINDLVAHDKAMYSQHGIDKLVNMCLDAKNLYGIRYDYMYPTPKVLIVVPVPLNENIDELPESFYSGKYEESLKYYDLYKVVADKYNVDILDAKQYAKTSTVDGLHLTEEGHVSLGIAVANKIKEMFK